jgi:hypothetical protein
MAEALPEPDRGQFPPGDLERVADVGEFQGHSDVFQRRHVGDQMEGLEDDADIAAAEIGERILRQGVQGLARNMYLALVEALETSQDHQQGRLARP